MIPNPYAVIAALVLWGASTAGAGWLGYGLGRDAEIAAKARESAAVTQGAEAAASATVDAINRNRPKHVQTRHTIEREIRTVPDLSGCSSGPDSVRDFNAGIPAESGTAGGGVPAPVATP